MRSSRLDGCAALLVAVAVIQATAVGGLAQVPGPTSDAPEVDAPPTWTDRSIPTDRDLHEVHFVNGSEGWVAADDGVLYHTTDGGKTWDAVHSGLVDPLEMMSWGDEDHGWVATSTLGIARTTDGGSTWEVLQKGVYIGDLKEIEFVDDQNGYIAGENGIFMGYVAATSDGGDTWQALNLSFPSQEHYFYEVEWTEDGETGWVGTWTFKDGDGVSITHDGGDSWEFHEIPITFANRARDLDMATERTGVVVGTRGTIFRTTDGGVSWDRVPAPTTASLRDVEFVDDRRGWAVGQRGTVLTTIDGGRSWTPEATGTIADLEQGAFLPGGDAWVAGEDATVVHRQGNRTVQDIAEETIDSLPRELHPPIVVVGDDGFQSPTSGVVAGSGTEEDPYVIAGWEIVPTGTAGISLLNTTAHVVIRDNHVHDAPGDNAGIRLVDARNVVVEDNRLDANGQGLVVTGGGPTTIRNNTVASNDGDGIRVSAVTDLAIEDNLVRASGQDGIQVTDLSGTRIAGNDLKANPGAAVRIGQTASTGTDNVTVTGNTFQDDGVGLHATRATDLVVRDNDLLLAEHQGVLVESSTGTVIDGNHVAQSSEAEIRVGAGSTGTVVEDNVVDARVSGIQLSGDTATVVRGNHVEGGSDEGIKVAGSTAPRIVENRVRPGNMAIRVTDGTDRAIVRDNHASGGHWGIWLQGGTHDSVVEDNLIHGEDVSGGIPDTHEGVTVLGESHRNVIRDNVAHNVSVGVSLIGGSEDNVVEGNVVRDVRFNGLVAGYHAAGSVIRNNTATDVGRYGLVVADRADGSVATDNTLRNVSERGISVTSVSDVRLADNVVDGAGTGLVVDVDALFASSSDLTNVTIEHATLRDVRDAGVVVEELDVGEVRDVRLLDTNVTSGGAEVALAVHSGPREVVVNGTNLEGFAIGLNATDAGTVDVTHNWWGAEDGPSGEGPGSGAKIITGPATTALFEPWLESPNADAGARR